MIGDKCPLIDKMIIKVKAIQSKAGSGLTWGGVFVKEWLAEVLAVLSLQGEVYQLWLTRN